jgi:hypothetical protein
MRFAQTVAAVGFVVFQSVPDGFRAQNVQWPIESVVIGSQPVVLAAPPGFVEVSRLFPDGYSLRQEALPKANRLLAWLLPLESVKDRLNGSVGTGRTALQMQVHVDLIQGRYDAKTIESTAAEIRKGFQVSRESVQPQNPTKFSEAGIQINAPRILGVFEQGRDFVTIGTEITGQAQRGERSRLVLTSTFLIREKLVYLVATGGSDSPGERAALLKTLGEWRSALSAANR